MRLRGTSCFVCWASGTTRSSTGEKLADEFDAPADRRRVGTRRPGRTGAEKPAEAEALLRAILDDDPDDAGACNDLGYHLADQGRNLDEAERLVRHALAVDRLDRRKSGGAEPENAAYRDSLGWVLFRRGKLADAKARAGEGGGVPDGRRPTRPCGTTSATCSSG